jgi:hypothetical protein
LVGYFIRSGRDDVQLKTPTLNQTINPRAHSLRSYFQELCSAILGEEFEGATMTRIGRWQIKTRQLAGNASYRRDKLAPLKIFKSNSRLTLTPPGPQAFS